MVKNRFVNVQLTLLSIAVALILENLLGVFHNAEIITPLILVQSVEIGISAISMWVGFAYGISSVNKPPHLMDFLVHFLLLFTLSTAVTFIGTGNLPGYFIAAGLGSASAALCLRLDVVLAHRAGRQGPNGTFLLLASIASIELGIGLLALTVTLTAPVAILLLIPVITLQGITAMRSIRSWQERLALRQQPPSDRP